MTTKRPQCPLPTAVESAYPACPTAQPQPSMPDNVNQPCPLPPLSESVCLPHPQSHVRGSNDPLPPLPTVPDSDNPPPHLGKNPVAS